jgi:hypothetical protein
LATAAVFALSGGLASAAGSHPAATSAGTHAKAHRFISGSPDQITLYDQNANDGGTGVTSQNFETTYDAYDNQGADDFTVPEGHRWTVKEVNVTGVYYNGFGPAVSENVFIFKDNHGLPGTLVVECDSVAGQDNGTGSFVIKLPKECFNPHLNAGHYWVSVQVNMDFGVGGQWGWEVNSVQNGDLAAWQNPGDGFATGCTSWGTLEGCLSFGPDFMFALRGNDHIR